tara:strand:- start:1203 stop:1820 length:618 start_codon:yes stop_codon:yes gene_type:complete
MKNFCFFLITVFLTGVSNAELRTWTAVNGKQVKAEFVSSSRGIVKLRLESGKVFEVQLDKLSKEDHEFILGLDATPRVGAEPINLDKYRKELADPKTRSDIKKFESILTELILEQEKVPSLDNVINYEISEKQIVFLFGKPTSKRRISDEGVTNTGKILYVYKDFWNDIIAESKVSLRLTINEWKGDLYWSGRYSNFSGDTKILN